MYSIVKPCINGFMYNHYIKRKKLDCTCPIDLYGLKYICYLFYFALVLMTPVCLYTIIINNICFAHVLLT